MKMLSPKTASIPGSPRRFFYQLFSFRSFNSSNQTFASSSSLTSSVVKPAMPPNDAAATTTTASNATSATTTTPDTVWYLAYGSNMEPKVFSGRRKIQPIESKTVVVPGYWLSFDIGGIPFVEPCFASILKIDESRLMDRDYAYEVFTRTQYGREFVWDESHPDHPMRSYPPVLQGVAHKITPREWQLVLQSEGGWGHDVPTGYNQISVDCKVQGTGEHLSALVLEARPLSVKTHCQPTARYKNLLTSGAAFHKIDPAYQQYLAGIVPYECAGFRSKVARVLVIAANSPLMIMFAIMLLRNRNKTPDQLKRPPYWVAWTYDKASRFSAALHDYLIAPVLGSGRCSTIEHQSIVRKRIEAEMKDGKTAEEHQKCREVDADKEGAALKMAENVLESTAE